MAENGQTKTPGDLLRLSLVVIAALVGGGGGAGLMNGATREKVDALTISMREVRTEVTDVGKRIVALETMRLVAAQDLGRIEQRLERIEKGVSELRTTK